MRVWGWENSTAAAYRLGVEGITTEKTSQSVVIKRDRDGNSRTSRTHDQNGNGHVPDIHTVDDIDPTLP